MKRPAPDDVYARIRKVVEAVPRGRVATYGQIAVLAGIPGHARQVGYALRTLPDESDVPWQRIVNANGRVSHRAGEDLVGPSQGFQRHLLLEEGVVFDSAGRVDLERYGWKPRIGLALRARGRGAARARRAGARGTKRRSP